MLAKYADPKLREQEKSAWEKAMVEKYVCLISIGGHDTGTRGTETWHRNLRRAEFGFSRLYIICVS